MTVSDPAVSPVASRQSATEAAISARGLTKSYGSFDAVRGISFEVARGEIVAFLGPNGAGKTTTVEILEGFRNRSAGEVRVLGEDPQSAPPMWRDRIGVVLQDSEAERDLTAGECLELYAGYHRHPRPVAETLDLVGLKAKAGTRGSELSGGQRRRLDVALALIGDPELVFLDEPTTGFDPSARRQAWEVVDGLRSLGKTIFLTTHYMDEAEFLADRIIVVARGQIVAQGQPSSIAERDRRPAVVSFSLISSSGAASIPKPPLGSSQGQKSGRFVFTSGDSAHDVSGLSAWADASEVTIRDLEIRKPTLEDIYLELTTSTDKGTTGKEPA